MHSQPSVEAHLPTRMKHEPMFVSCCRIIPDELTLRVQEEHIDPSSVELVRNNLLQSHVEERKVLDRNPVARIFLSGTVKSGAIHNSLA